MFTSVRIDMSGGAFASFRQQVRQRVRRGPNATQRHYRAYFNPNVHGSVGRFQAHLKALMRAHFRHVDHVA